MTKHIYIKYLITAFPGGRVEVREDGKQLQSNLRWDESRGAIVAKNSTHDVEHCGDSLAEAMDDLRETLNEQGPLDDIMGVA